MCILRILDGEAELIARISDIDRHELKKDFSAILARLPSTYERVLGIEILFCKDINVMLTM